MNPPRCLAAFEAQAPEQVWKENPELLRYFAHHGEVGGQSNSFRKALTFKRERSKELPVDQAQLVDVRAFHGALGGDDFHNRTTRTETATKGGLHVRDRQFNALTLDFAGVLLRLLFAHRVIEGVEERFLRIKVQQ